LKLETGNLKLEGGSGKAVSRIGPVAGRAGSSAFVLPGFQFQVSSFALKEILAPVAKTEVAGCNRKRLHDP